MKDRGARNKLKKMNKIKSENDGCERASVEKRTVAGCGAHVVEMAPRQLSRRGS